jgi:hypothetical protein
MNDKLVQKIGFGNLKPAHHCHFTHALEHHRRHARHKHGHAKHENRATGHGHHALPEKKFFSAKTADTSFPAAKALLGKNKRSENLRAAFRNAAIKDFRFGNDFISARFERSPAYTQAVRNAAIPALDSIIASGTAFAMSNAANSMSSGYNADILTKGTRTANNIRNVLKESILKPIGKTSYDAAKIAKLPFGLLETGLGAYNFYEAASQFSAATTAKDVFRRNEAARAMVSSGALTARGGFDTASSLYPVAKTLGFEKLAPRVALSEGSLALGRMLAGATFIADGAQRIQGARDRFQRGMISRQRHDAEIASGGIRAALGIGQTLRNPYIYLPSLMLGSAVLAGDIYLNYKTARQNSDSIADAYQYVARRLS